MKLGKIAQVCATLFVNDSKGTFFQVSEDIKIVLFGLVLRLAGQPEVLASVSHHLSVVFRALGNVEALDFQG